MPISRIMPTMSYYFPLCIADFEEKPLAVLIMAVVIEFKL
jgi:hypothetical protein